MEGCLLLGLGYVTKIAFNYWTCSKRSQTSLLIFLIRGDIMDLDIIIGIIISISISLGWLCVNIYGIISLKRDR